MNDRGSEPTGKVPVAPWMTAPETETVMAALTADGGEARFVGGCVRNALLKRPAHDIDIATVETPDRVVALLEAAGIRAIPTGIDHGTVTAVVGDRPFRDHHPAHRRRDRRPPRPGPLRR